MIHLLALALFLSGTPRNGLPESSGSYKNQNQGNLEFLRQYKGKYPHEVQLFKNPVLRKRLKKLMGSRFNYLINDIFQVETPIRLEGDYFYAWAMQTHSGGDPSAKLIADLGENKLYVEIQQGTQTLIYTEGGSKSIPKSLDAWVKAQSDTQ
jgi:hypothetical protein